MKGGTRFPIRSQLAAIRRTAKSHLLVIAAIAVVAGSIFFNYYGSPAVQPYPGEAAPAPATNSPGLASDNPFPSGSFNWPDPPSNVQPPVGTGGGDGGDGGGAGGGVAGGAGQGTSIGGDIALAVIPLGLFIVLIRLGSLQSSGLKRGKSKRLSEEELYHSISDIREMCQQRFEEEEYEDVMIHGFHALDTVLANYYGLSRAQAMTPLEFAEGTMLSPLEGLVSLFYEARYGHKGRDRQRAASFIEELDKLSTVIQDTIADEDKQVNTSEAPEDHVEHSAIPKVTKTRSSLQPDKWETHDV